LGQLLALFFTHSGVILFGLQRKIGLNMIEA